MHLHTWCVAGARENRLHVTCGPFDTLTSPAPIAATGKGQTARSWAWGDLVRIFQPGREPELSLAKAQMLFWTILLLVLFVSKSILEGQIWDVPWPLVALMGFSQLGYLAPKVANPATPPPPAGPSSPPAGSDPPTLTLG
jgi:hypothetical protein